MQRAQEGFVWARGERGPEMDFHAQSFQTQAPGSSVCFANPYHPTVIACEVEQKMNPAEDWMAGLAPA